MYSAEGQKCHSKGVSCRNVQAKGLSAAQTRKSPLRVEWARLLLILSGVSETIPNSSVASLEV
jgi:hypothetical protein